MTCVRVRVWAPLSTRSPRRCCGTCGCLRVGFPVGMRTSCASSQRVTRWPISTSTSGRCNTFRHLTASPQIRPTRSGRSDTSWSRLSSTTTLTGIAEVLETSRWQLRGCRTPREFHLGLRLAWADAVVAGVPEAAGWARAAAALLVLKEVLLEGRRPYRAAGAARVIRAGTGVRRCVGAAARSTWRGCGTALPSGARWVLDGIDQGQDLWRGEAAWWHRVERDGFALLRGSGYDRGPVVGALAVLAVDVWRVRAALETAARGGAGPTLEAFDGVA